MNWIKSNIFVSALAGITFVVCAGLYLLASQFSGSHAQAKTEFDEAYQSVNQSESIPLYPTIENRDGKLKALTDYRKSIEEFSALYNPFRVNSLENVSPQVFTDKLKSSQEELTEEFTKRNCALPEGFFLGFDTYRSQLAQSDATGALGYQMAGIKEALLHLARANPSALVKIYRDSLLEENGKKFQAEPNAISRSFPFEVTFKGSESSAREFINSLGSSKDHYYIVRCLKIQNQSDVPPKVSDAKFGDEESVDSADNSSPAADSLAAAFADPNAAPVEASTQTAAVPVEDSTPTAPVADDSRILAQVLGAEELSVFVRVDLVMFLEQKELPKP